MPWNVIAFPFRRIIFEKIHFKMKKMKNKKKKMKIMVTMLLVVWNQKKKKCQKMNVARDQKKQRMIFPIKLLLLKVSLRFLKDLID